MTEMRPSLDAAYFDRLYAEAADPWNFAESAYEHAKYQHTLQALPRERYGSALEVGCSIGVLTASLAQRCGRLLAVDAAEAPLVQARRRCADEAHVRIERRRVPEEWPDGTFDLILLSEVLYYLAPVDLREVAQRAGQSTRSGGHILLVHWTGETDYPLSGDAATEWFISAIAPHARLLRQEATSAYRLALLERE
ncbi:methyltransferase [Azorhizobium oxalatiphilum]|uniref:Methyltransferase n=1 Tax=Azorhizobium oxalatiphilum TaxID=980631 RepID=A0A917C652_9HYPH|nr:SAM-dependent methyltransferase [Azorhizobium oxalatiphilum]GGF69886.1 methyltransferase [Azorhizobium oxalatiphilum]